MPRDLDAVRLLMDDLESIGARMSDGESTTYDGLRVSRRDLRPGLWQMVNERGGVEVQVEELA